MGGMQCIFVMDPLQLPPIEPQLWDDREGQEKPPPPMPRFAHDTNVCRRLCMSVVRLQHAHRHTTASARFLRLLEHVRCGQVDDDDTAYVDELADKVVPQDAVILVGRRETAQAINNECVPPFLNAFGYTAIPSRSAEDVLHEEKLK